MDNKFNIDSTHQELSVERKKLDRFAYFLPNTFTALNIACGFGAMLVAAKGEFYQACMLIILGALFDSVDGRIARLTGTQSAFGEQFDSLSDLISFGLAPSIIFYHKFLVGYSRVGIVVSFLFLLCGALRLARFNANINKVKSDYFQGLPIPGAASAIVGFVLISLESPDYLSSAYITIPYMIIYSFLMISNFPFPSFKKAPWVQKNKKKMLFIIFLILASMFLYESVMIFLVVSLYVVFSLIYGFTHRSELANLFDWEEEIEL